MKGHGLTANSSFSNSDASRESLRNRLFFKLNISEYSPNYHQASLMSVRKKIKIILSIKRHKPKLRGVCSVGTLKTVYALRTSTTLLMN